MSKNVRRIKCQSYNSCLLEFIAKDDAELKALLQDSLKASVFSQHECSAIIHETSKLVASLGSENYTALGAFIDNMRSILSRGLGES